MIIHDLTTSQSWKVGKHVPNPDGPIDKFEWHPSGSMSYTKWRYAREGSSLDGVEELHLVDSDGQNDTIVVDDLPFAFIQTTEPGSVWVKVADLTPEIRNQLEH